MLTPKEYLHTYLLMFGKEAFMRGDYQPGEQEFLTMVGEELVKTGAAKLKLASGKLVPAVQGTELGLAYRMLCEEYERQSNPKGYMAKHRFIQIEEDSDG